MSGLTEITDGQDYLAINDDGSINTKSVAGTEIIGKVGIDQTTDGTTNKVQARNSTHDEFNANANLQINDLDVDNANPVPVDLREIQAGTNLIGKVGIDQVTANANEVVTKTGSVTNATLQAETTKVIGTVNNKVADGDDITLGAKADAPATTGTTDPWSVIALLKGLYNKLGAVVLAAGSAIIGQVGIDQTTDETTNKVRTDGVTKDTYAVTALASSGVIKASAGKLYGLAGINDSASDQYLQIFASATVPADTTVPELVLFIPAKSNFSFDMGMYGFTIGTGISWSNSSTLATKTIGVADLWLNAIYI